MRGETDISFTVIDYATKRKIQGSFPEVRIAEIDSSTETETTTAENTGVSFPIVITRED